MGFVNNNIFYLQQERSNSAKTPTSAKPESKVLKRKLFSSTANTSDDEGKKIPVFYGQ